MKNVLTIALLTAGILLVSCSDDEGGVDNPTPIKTFTILDATEQRGFGEDAGELTTYPQREVTGVLNQDVTFTSDSVWILNGRVVVDAGVTLTIEPGTILKGTPGQGALSSVLLVASGATININGTATNPVVMTALSDNINVEGLDYYDAAAGAILPSSDGFSTQGLDVATDIGLWGGLIVLGDATISDANTTSVIEGIPETVSQASYGGTNDTYNAGSITYLSLRFTGSQLGPGNELQGLTVGGLGSGTTINHVESIASADDGTEIFGGSVNMTNFIVWGQEDDGYDADQAWTGTVDNFLYFGTYNGASTSDHAFELDGPEGSIKGVGNFTNGTVWGDVSTGMIDLRDDAEYAMDGILFFNFSDEGADIEMDEDDNSFTNSENYVTTETTSFNNIQFFNIAKGASLIDMMDAKGDDTNNFASLADTKFSTTATNSVLTALAGATVGATVGTDFDWSYTAQTFAGWSSVPK